MTNVAKRLTAIALALAVGAGSCGAAVCGAAETPREGEITPQYAYHTTSVIDKFNEFKTDLQTITHINPTYKTITYETGFNRYPITLSSWWGTSGTAVGTWYLKQYSYTTY